LCGYRFSAFRKIFPDSVSANFRLRSTGPFRQSLKYGAGQVFTISGSHRSRDLVTGIQGAHQADFIGITRQFVGSFQKERKATEVRVVMRLRRRVLRFDLTMSDRPPLAFSDPFPITFYRIRTESTFFTPAFLPSCLFRKIVDYSNFP
jgi:hypothetical protein